MTRLFGPRRVTPPSDRMAHDLLDGLDRSRRPRRVLVVGDESEPVARVLRERLPGAVVVAVHAIEALEHWGGWADLIVSAWTGGLDATGLAIRLRTAVPGGAMVAVLDRGAMDLVDALQRQFAPVDWSISSPPSGGQPLLRFVGEAAA